MVIYLKSPKVISTVYLSSLSREISLHSLRELPTSIFVHFLTRIEIKVYGQFKRFTTGKTVSHILIRTFRIFRIKGLLQVSNKGHIINPFCTLIHNSIGMIYINSTNNIKTIDCNSIHDLKYNYFSYMNFNFGMFWIFIFTRLFIFFISQNMQDREVQILVVLHTSILL